MGLSPSGCDQPSTENTVLKTFSARSSPRANISVPCCILALSLHLHLVNLNDQIKEYTLLCCRPCVLSQKFIFTLYMER